MIGNFPALKTAEIHVFYAFALDSGVWRTLVHFYYALLLVHGLPLVVPVCCCWLYHMRCHAKKYKAI